MLGELGNKWGWRRWVAMAIALGTLSLQTGCRAETPWPLWQQYRARFIEASGRVIDHDPGSNERTTSEGMAYSMFFALVVNDRPTFDKLLRWTEDNLAGGDLRHGCLPGTGASRRTVSGSRSTRTLPRMPTCGWRMTCWKPAVCGRTIG